MGAQKGPARSLAVRATSFRGVLAGRPLSVLLRACCCAPAVGASCLAVEAGDDAVLFPDLAIPIAASGARLAWWREGH